MAMMTNQEHDVQLQSYLEEQLSLIPDTDPQLLSKLVLALLKMDLPIDELKNLCKEKLEDFLKYRTVQFVDGLFSYISFMNDNQVEEYKTIHVNHQSVMNMDRSSVEDDEDDDGDYAFRRRRQRFGENAYKQIETKDNLPRRGRGMSRSRGIHRPFISKRSHYHHTSFIPQKMLTSQGKRLFVDNIPEEFSSKNVIEEYFSKFGPVHLINHQGNRATIEFENHEHAVSAFSSPEPIFQNRFVKLFWDTNTPEHSSTLYKQKEEMIAKYTQQISELQSKLSSASSDQTQELQKSIQTLQDSISQLQEEKFIGKFSHRGGYQAATRSGNMTWRPTKLDLRPKTITISPIPSPLSGNEENVQKYFGQFGTIVSIVFCQNHIEIQYKERYEAENAMKLGSKVSFANMQFPFTINWKNPIQNTNMNPMTLANNTNDSWDDDAYERSWRR